MAKGQVSEKDLEASIASLGGLGGLATTGASGAKRDSPFGSGFVKRASPPAAETPGGAAGEREPVKPIELKTRVETPPLPAPERPAEPAGRVQSSSRSQVRADQKPKAKAGEPQHSRKCDTLTERVTVQMSPEMRDDVGEIARRLQRRKADKKSERITANTVMRVAIQFLLDELTLDDQDRPSTEDELLLLVKHKLG